MHMHTNTRKGFTLIELLVVVGIIAVVTAIALPNLLRSRLSANEASAVTVVKTYSGAQVTFQTSRNGRLETNTKTGPLGYCDNFRNLFYGNPVNDPEANLALISRAFANAFARESGENQAKTRNTPLAPREEALHYQGFLFAEPIETLETPNTFATTFALVGVPVESGITGDNAFWIGTQGNVRFTGLGKGVKYSTSIDMETPSTPGAAKWTGL